jgi:hypothetical protein
MWQQHNIPCRASNIPGSSSITELTLTLHYWFPGDLIPSAAAASAAIMAAALPRLRSLNIEVPECPARGELRCCLLPWLQALPAFTQLQQLAVTVPESDCAHRCSNHHEEPLVAPEAVVHALCQLSQLQHLTLSGWPWDVSPLLVVSLELGLPQLTKIKFEDYGPAGDQEQQAAVRQGMAAGLRAGLQMEFVD